MSLAPKKSILYLNGRQYAFYALRSIPGYTVEKYQRLPYSIRILLEACYRNEIAFGRELQNTEALLDWSPKEESRRVIPFWATRVVLQDFTGVPVLVDLAAMRSAAARQGKDPQAINPVVPVDLVIDHSVQVDEVGPDALAKNVALEFQRNRERYEFMKWAQRAFKNIRIVPPATGIVHQVNLEYLSQVVVQQDYEGETFAFPETLVGTDSHTTMINGLGVIGWGVGGIEAIAAMLGEPLEIVAPDVVGFRLKGNLKPGATPTDLTLTITQMLRKAGVVDKFVEFFGPGLSHLSLSDRAMISNMTPENGATISYFPVDDRTLEYLRLTGRSTESILLVERLFKEQGLFRSEQDPDPDYSMVIELDMSTVEPSLAGPKRPQDRLLLRDVRENFHKVLIAPKIDRGYEMPLTSVENSVQIDLDGKPYTLKHGSVVIAAITSCTNTSNPTVMIAAGLLAQKAVEKGLLVSPVIKTSLAPGSRVVVDYLAKAGLLSPLAKLGFNLVGFGCTTCIGNSGPIRTEVANAIQSGKLITAAVLSGNRNFEGRIHPQVQANYLASPSLVVAYALAGRVDIDMDQEPLGVGNDGRPVYLADLWPTWQEVENCIQKYVTKDLFQQNYSTVFMGTSHWNSIESQTSAIFAWNEQSTYIQEPPYLQLEMTERNSSPRFENVRALAKFGDSITTDHISPAGNISPISPAGEYLLSQGVPIEDFNSYGSRRGNDRVMTRGTFANIRLKNQMIPGVEGGFTRYLPTGEQMSIFEAAKRYQEAGIPLLVLAGKEYGTGSSRDWAAKGVLLLGVKVVLAESFERIHRSNLVCMGILPLQFKPGQSAAYYGLTGNELFEVENFTGEMQPRAEVNVYVQRENGQRFSFLAIARIDTPIEVEYYQNGGLLPAIYRKITSASS